MWRIIKLVFLARMNAPTRGFGEVCFHFMPTSAVNFVPFQPQLNLFFIYINPPPFNTAYQ